MSWFSLAGIGVEASAGSVVGGSEPGGDRYDANIECSKGNRGSESIAQKR